MVGQTILIVTCSLALVACLVATLGLILQAIREFWRDGEKRVAALFSGGLLFILLIIAGCILAYFGI